MLGISFEKMAALVEDVSSSRRKCSSQLVWEGSGTKGAESVGTIVGSSVIAEHGRWNVISKELDSKQRGCICEHMNIRNSSNGGFHKTME